MKIKDVLQKGIDILKENEIEDCVLKSRILFSNLINKSKEYIMIHDNEEIEEKIIEEFLQKIERIKNNEPIQYIINSQEFMGLDFYVDKNVLIPQPDTEILVDEVINISKPISNEKNIKILDLCTGSGAIAISLAMQIKESEIYASDISQQALIIAQKNSEKHDVKIHFIKSDLFNELDNITKFDIIVSNPPYIKTKVINVLPEEVKKEPIIALDGGEDGLEFYKKIIKQAHKYLNNNGYLAFEIGYDQKEEVMQLLKDNNYKNIFSKKDLGNNDRIIIAQYFDNNIS